MPLVSPPAGASPGGIITDALRWKFTVQVAYDWARLAQLFFSVSFNLPVTIKDDFYLVPETA